MSPPSPDLSRLEYRHLSRADLPALGSFTCGDPDLDGFLRDDAARLGDADVVRTYLARLDGEVVGYLSVLADAVVLETRERGAMPLLTAGDHPVVPAIKVARVGSPRTDSDRASACN